MWPHHLPHPSYVRVCIKLCFKLGNNAMRCFIVFRQEITGKIQMGCLPNSKAVRPMLKMLNAKNNHRRAKQMKMGSSEVKCLWKQKNQHSRSNQHIWNFVWVTSENSERKVARKVECGELVSQLWQCTYSLCFVP
jgi:hypothetical protein